MPHAVTCEDASRVRAGELATTLAGRVNSPVDAFSAEGGQPGLALRGDPDGGSCSPAAGGSRAVRGWRPAVPDADTVFRIASMTKSFTAAVILPLRDEGALALDDEAARYVPGSPGRPPTADARR